MKLVPVDVPESYLKLIKKICMGAEINRSELVRQAVKSFLIREITLTEELKNELEDNRSPDFLTIVLIVKVNFILKQGRVIFFIKILKCS